LTLLLLLSVASIPVKKNGMGDNTDQMGLSYVALIQRVVELATEVVRRIKAIGVWVECSSCMQARV
jgi:hypothetical protein